MHVILIITADERRFLLKAASVKSIWSMAGRHIVQITHKNLYSTKERSVFLSVFFMSQNNTNFAPNADWVNAHGPVPVRMTNDYLFRALMQRNERTLKVLTCALLHLNPDNITVDLRNPIVLGETIEDKDFILNLLLLLNNGTIINTEMQVINEESWLERSLCYLCRAFDNLNTGEKYKHVHPAVQIGLLNFTLFTDSPEFYASYYL